MNNTFAQPTLLGLFDLASWYGLYPLHQLLFARMLKALARAADKRLDDILEKPRE